MSDPKEEQPISVDRHGFKSVEESEREAYLQPEEIKVGMHVTVLRWRDKPDKKQWMGDVLKVIAISFPYCVVEVVFQAANEPIDLRDTYLSVLTDKYVTEMAKLKKARAKIPKGSRPKKDPLSPDEIQKILEEINRQRPPQSPPEIYPGIPYQPLPSNPWSEPATGPWIGDAPPGWPTTGEPPVWTTFESDFQSTLGDDIDFDRNSVLIDGPDPRFGPEFADRMDLLRVYHRARTKVLSRGVSARDQRTAVWAEMQAEYAMRNETPPPGHVMDAFLTRMAGEPDPGTPEHVRHAQEELAQIRAILQQ